AQGLAALQAASPDRWPTPSAYDVTNYEMTPANVLLHATFLFGFVPKYVFATLLPDWSIALEMQFYAFFPLLFLVFRRISWIGLLIVGVGASVCCNHIFGRLPGPFSSVGLYPEPSLLLMKLPLFLIGMLGAEVFLSAKHKPRESALMTILAVLLAAHYSILTGLVAGLICFLAWSRIPDNSRNTSAAVVASWLNRLLSNRCTAFMADASYSVYLTHCVLISLLGGFLFRRPDFVALSAPLRVAILVAVVAAGAYLLAWVLHNVVEKPGIELGKRLANWWLPVTAAVKTSNGRAATVNQPHTVATTNAYD
ncbi:MAG: acyltransferase family protein, partial [Limisphaerales bacterium]